MDAFFYALNLFSWVGKYCATSRTSTMNTAIAFR